MGQCLDCPHIDQTPPTRARCCLEDGSRAASESARMADEARERAEQESRAPHNRHARRAAARMRGEP